jgi:PST family polysaccharide transporter
MTDDRSPPDLPPEPRSYGRRALSGALWLSFARAINVAANLAAIAVLARLLTPEQFGLFAVAGIVVALANTLSDGAFALPLVQREDVTPVHIRTALWASLLMASTIAAVVALAAPWLQHFFGFAELQLILFAIVPVLLLKAVASVGLALLQRAHRFSAITGIMVVTQVIGYVGPAILLAALGFGVWSLVIAQLVSGLLEAACFYAATRFPARPAVKLDALKEILSFGGYLTLGRLANWGALQIDNIIVGRALGAEALGLYSRAYNLLAVSTTVLGDPAFRVLFPAFARLQADRARLQAGFKRALAVALPFYACVSAFAILHGGAAVLLVLGPRWMEAVAPLQLLFAAFIARAGYKYTESILLATGRSAQAAARQIIYFVLVALSAIAGSFYGIAGVAAGVSIAIWGFYIVSLIWLRSVVTLGEGWLLHVHLRALLLAGLAAAADLGLQWALQGAHFWLQEIGGGMAFGLAGLALVGFAPAWLLGADLVTARGMLRSWHNGRAQAPGE